MRIAIISLRFNPGHFSHLAATYRLVEEAGHEAILYVHPAFARMDPAGTFRRVTRLAELRATAPIDVAVFWFPAFGNLGRAGLFRCAWRTRIVYVYHEPLPSLAPFVRAGFRASRLLRILAVERVNRLMVGLSDFVVLPSRNALEAFRRVGRSYWTEHAMIPLIFDDEAGGEPPTSPRTYISYIGAIAVDHGFDEFVAWAEEAIERGWFPARKFSIVTRHRLPEALLQRLARPIRDGVLTVQHGKDLTNDELNVHFSSSAMVWGAYRRSTQSGIIPKAFMFGCPVLAAATVTDEFVQHGVNGAVVRDTANREELRRAAELILADEDMPRRCRQAFSSIFYYPAAREGYARALGEQPRAIST